MYQNDFFIGIVEQAQKKEYAHTSGSIDTTKDIFGDKKIGGNIHTELMTSYEFKLQGHSEVFHKYGNHVIQVGDKMIFQAVKNKYGIFELGVCKNFTHGWIVGGSSRKRDIMRIPIDIIKALILSFLSCFLIVALFDWFVPSEYEVYLREYKVYVEGLFYLIFATITLFLVIKYIKNALNTSRINKEFREMQFPENFNE
ncbi:hypothetical protein YZ63_07540 [Campylobacter upsaliensis]|nr:hypothetical protein [Campylobacter upsaliensis]